MPQLIHTTMSVCISYPFLEIELLSSDIIQEIFFENLFVCNFMNLNNPIGWDGFCDNDILGPPFMLSLQ